MAQTDRLQCWPAGQVLRSFGSVLRQFPVCWYQTDTGISCSEMSPCPIRLAHIFSDGDTGLRMVLYQVPGAQRWDSSSVISGTVMWAPICLLPDSVQLKLA